MKEIRDENKTIFMECILRNLDRNNNCSTIEFNNVPNHEVEMFETYLEELQDKNLIQKFELDINMFYKIYFSKQFLDSIQ